VQNPTAGMRVFRKRGLVGVLQRSWNSSLRNNLTYQVMTAAWKLLALQMSGIRLSKSGKLAEY
jgi:hypothetical protein